MRSQIFRFYFPGPSLTTDDRSDRQQNKNWYSGAQRSVYDQQKTALHEKERNDAQREEDVRRRRNIENDRNNYKDSARIFPPGSRQTETFDNVKEFSLSRPSSQKNVKITGFCYIQSSSESDSEESDTSYEEGNQFGHGNNTDNKSGIQEKINTEREQRKPENSEKNGPKNDNDSYQASVDTVDVTFTKPSQRVQFVLEFPDLKKLPHNAQADVEKRFQDAHDRKQKESVDCGNLSRHRNTTDGDGNNEVGIEHEKCEICEELTSKTIAAHKITEAHEQFNQIGQCDVVSDELKNDSNSVDMKGNVDCETTGPTENGTSQSTEAWRPEKDYPYSEFRHRYCQLQNHEKHLMEQLPYGFEWSKRKNADFLAKRNEVYQIRNELRKLEIQYDSVSAQQEFGI
uniref:J domain-containing protein n=1 Tax=Caenorhabditis tropicalis TaxID=1561998 RepID=A0A1I7U060_9PELO